MSTLCAGCGILWCHITSIALGRGPCDSHRVDPHQNGRFDRPQHCEPLAAGVWHPGRAATLPGSVPKRCRSGTTRCDSRR
ncbi:hypothetical protein HaLaN_19965 [Haematococcus lacustris]|uniref:Secreted protein n=1 Tax=Haematococcus lacustris TaxID=44745 RepID=A0A699ZJK2_HAELA|nr:hypothetical protein HaLaN_19965 [Haematococcus lacustris]